MDLNKKNTLRDIFQELFDIDISKLSSEELEYKLLDKEFNFRARDLVYLFFEIENRFNIKIKENYIIQGQFQSINDIINIINYEVAI